MMKLTCKVLFFLHTLFLCANFCTSAKINTPRVLLPWLEDLNVNFTFEIIEGGCYSWSLSRDDVIDLEPQYEDSWGHCSRSARVSVSKSCIPPGSVIILAEEVNTGEILRGDVDIDKISSLKVISTTWKLFLEEAPEAFEVIAYDDQGNKFTTLEGISFTWTVENTGSTVGEEPILTLVSWRDTDYEAPHGVSALEEIGLRSHSVLLYGQSMGEATVTVCLDQICTDFGLRVVASVVLMPATALIAPGDTLRYKVVRARAGRLTVQDVADTLYSIRLPHSKVALLEDTISLVRGTDIGTTNVRLMSGITEVAVATLTVTEPHSIRVYLRPANLIIRGEVFVVHCIVLDREGHALTAGNEMLIRLSVDGDANVDLIYSTENGTITDAVAQNSGPLNITARLYSIAGRTLSAKVEGQVSAVAVDPLEVVPEQLFVAWTDNVQEISLKHRGGGDEPVTWSTETADHSGFSLTPLGLATIRGEGEMIVRVQLKNYPYVKATGRVVSAAPELVQVSSSGHARVARPHHLHVALTATHPATGELYNFHTCNCASFAVTLLEGPEPQNVTAAPWVKPVEGACCVTEVWWGSRGVSVVRVSRGRAGDTARVAVRAAPALLWPPHDRVAALVPATLPIIAEGESLSGSSVEARVAELRERSGAPPHRHPDAHLFTLKCRRKGESRVEVASDADGEREAVELTAACAAHATKLRLDPADPPGNCTGGPRVWLRAGREAEVTVALLDAVGRELLDELGPKVSWETEPKHKGIAFKSTDRMFVETHPDFEPVPVPYKYYQLVAADEAAVGWSGALKASTPDATASIPARVVAPLSCDQHKVWLAWEGESVPQIAAVSGGSGAYAVRAPGGVAAEVRAGALSAAVPAPGAYRLVVHDLCVPDESVVVEVVIEEVLTVEVVTSRAVGAGTCAPVAAVARGASHRPLRAARPAEWRAAGPLAVRGDQLCGLAEGVGRVRAALAGVWSDDVEVVVFAPLEVVPARAQLPAGARLQLRHRGGPPPHLATLHYRALDNQRHVEVSPSGSVHGVSLGKARVRLVATDIADVEMASAESEVEVIPISSVVVRAATQTLLVGAPAPVWVEAGGLAGASLAALQPAPRLAWSVRDPAAARIYATHADDLLERSVAEGLSIRVVPLKPGVITIDVKVRNMGQLAESKTWESSIDILAISDIRVSVEGAPGALEGAARVAVAVGASVRLTATPRASWAARGGADAFELTAAGELTALRPGRGVAVAQHTDDRSNVHRETVIHVEVSTPVYCTAEPSDSSTEPGVRVVLRDAVGRALLAPAASVAASPGPALLRPHEHSALGTELLLSSLEPAGAFMSFESSVGGTTVRDEVWVAGGDAHADRIVALGGWAFCLEGVGWRAPGGGDVALHAGSGVTLAVLARDAAARHVLRRDRPAATATVHQLPVEKMEFLPGEWPSTMVPLAVEAAGVARGPLLCTEEQRYALEGLRPQLPFACRTAPPHTADAVLDLVDGRLGCSITPAGAITDASEAALCAEWNTLRTCTKVLLLPPIQLSEARVSLLNPPTTFTISGHPHALQLVKMSASPGLKLETSGSGADGEISVVVRSETTSCGVGWVNVVSRLTAQELRVLVESECDAACGTLLGALLALVRPYFTTLVTVAALAVAYVYVQAKLQYKSQLRMPAEPAQTVLPPFPADGSPGAPGAPPTPGRARTWSRSPYASAGPAAPVYGDASVLPDSSFSPSSTSTMHSRFIW